MMDGRFDQHFLEIFARNEEEDDRLAPGFALVLLALVAVGLLLV